jgi:hypothetical protein
MKKANEPIQAISNNLSHFELHNVTIKSLTTYSEFDTRHYLNRLNRFTKKDIHQIIKDCGGEGHYSGHEKVMYINHLINNIDAKTAFQTIAGYLFPNLTFLFV